MISRNEVTLAGVRFYTAWHLNLNYSSIDKEDHARVIDTCYWPILNLAQSATVPFGVEISGSTLETIDQIDPSWTRQAVALERRGLIEFIGSGYFQIIGPLAPHDISLANLSAGQDAIESIIGKRPTVGFVNEQCSSYGALEAIAETGFAAAILEWENIWLANPEWPKSVAYRPQKADVGTGLGLIWNQSRLFQSLQKVAHRELRMDHYLDLLKKLPQDQNAAVCFYAGDAETFDFRAGRFNSEALLGASEWGLVSDVIASIVDSGGQFILPGDLLGEIPHESLDLFNFGNQITTKKQAKYNPTRWAVGGRENYELNNYAFTLSQNKSYMSGETGTALNHELLELWSSDLRTHISDRRWKEHIAKHPHFATFSSDHQPDLTRPPNSTPLDPELGPLQFGTNTMVVGIDPSRGLTIDSLSTNCKCGLNLLGRLPFGSISGPGHSPDWYTGNVLFQEPGMPQETELTSRVDNKYWLANPSQLHSEHNSRSFRLLKRLIIGEIPGSLDLEYTFEWKRQARGATRAGLLTFPPEGWNWDEMVFYASNGASVRSKFPIGNKEVHHSSSVSPLVTAANCVGLTDGVISVSDGNHEIVVSLKDYSRGAVALLDFSAGPLDKFLRISFSLAEIDDTAQQRSSGSTAFGLSISAMCLLG